MESNLQPNLQAVQIALPMLTDEVLKQSCLTAAEKYETAVENSPDKNYWGVRFSIYYKEMLKREYYEKSKN